MAISKIMRRNVTDFYFAKRTATEGETPAVTFTPKAICHTANVSVSPQKGENKVWESGALIRNSNRVGSYNIDVESRTVSSADEMEIMYGKTGAGSDYEIDNAADDPIDGAVGFAYEYTDGSYDAYWYYNCTPSPGDESQESATESENTPTRKLSFVAMRCPILGKTFRMAHCADKTALAAFFASVTAAAG